MQLLVKIASHPLDNPSVAFKQVQVVQRWCGGFWFRVLLWGGRGEEDF